MYERTVGRSLEVQRLRPRSWWRPRAASQQLTFNHGPWRSQTASTDDWFASEGVLLVGRFQRWALEALPERFRETMVHVSLTLEESCHAAENVKRVHLRAQLTFRRRIDRTSVVDFVFEGVRPHVATRSYSEPSQSAVQSHLCIMFGLVGTTLLLFATLLLQEMNKARGAHVQVSRRPFLDYEVQPFWLMGWWAGSWAGGPQENLATSDTRATCSSAKSPTAVCCRTLRRWFSRRRPCSWTSSATASFASLPLLACPFDVRRIRRLASRKVPALAVFLVRPPCRLALR